MVGLSRGRFEDASPRDIWWAVDGHLARLRLLSVAIHDPKRLAETPRAPTREEWQVAQEQAKKYR